MLIGGGGAADPEFSKQEQKDESFGPLPGPNQCHPRIGTARPPDGCLPPKILDEASRKLGLGMQGGAGKSRGQLLKRLADHLKIPATNQRSLLNALPISEEEKKKLAAQYLRPSIPESWKEDPDMWLDSLNIRDVMKQYEEARPDFRFLGPYPIDFAAQDPNIKQKECLIQEMCDLNLKQEASRGKKHIGIIYNLDPHYKNGSHWVAAYINIPKKQCYYFDSYGMKPPRQIYKFMQWLTLQEPNLELGWNGREFQKSDSECGMYTMYFLDRMMNGEPYLKFCRRAPPDRFMLDLRDWMFST
jgi:hypothetical protein